MSTHSDPKRRALGRGLESLLPARAAAPAAPANTASLAKGQPYELPVDHIDRNPFQTRALFDEGKLLELAGSIAASGVVQPIVVRAGRDGRFTLITGERRLMASRKAGRETIPAVVREVSDVQAMEMTIVENLQRADLNAMEQARAFQRLSQDFSMTQEQIAQRTGKDRATIANFLRLLRLPEVVQQAVEAGELSFGHARALLALEDAGAITAAADKVRALHLSVRGTETYVQGLLTPRPKGLEKTQAPADPNVREAEDQLRRALGLKVTISDKRGKGKVVIEYGSVDDFDAILSALGSPARA